MFRSLFPALLIAGLTAGCNGGISGEEDVVSRAHRAAPPGAAPDTCWDKEVSPAVIETVTEQIILQPAEIMADGTVVQPAVYKTETRQAIVKERNETWFQIPCAEMQTPDFVASVQRALSARGYYRGPVSGELDRRTRNAIRAYQKPQGLDSGVLSLAAARQLGLVALGRDDEI